MLKGFIMEKYTSQALTHLQIATFHVQYPLQTDL